jgi:hypothetical protein
VPKSPLILLLSLGFMFGLALQAGAFTVTYTGADLNYSVDKVSGHDVKETYGATVVINNQVVDPGPLFFDTLIQFDAKDVKKGNFDITFKVENTSSFQWTDYHLILTNAPGAVFTKAQSADFKDATISADKLIEDFFDGSIASGSTLQLNVAFDLTGLPKNGGTLNLRQIAGDPIPVPVPLPGALLLLGGGLVRLAAYSRRKAQATA